MSRYPWACHPGDVALIKREERGAEDAFDALLERPELDASLVDTESPQDVTCRPKTDDVVRGFAGRLERGGQPDGNQPILAEGHAYAGIRHDAEDEWAVVPLVKMSLDAFVRQAA